jgi:hypothetical protein
MDQRSIVLYLNRKGWTAQVIRDDLVATLDAQAVAYRTATGYLRMAHIIARDATAISATISPHIDESDEPIVRVVEELLFSSVRQLAYPTYLTVTTV